jgi:hypothetical protein
MQTLMRAVMEKDNEKMMEFAGDAEIMTLMARFQELARDAGIDPSTMGR